MCSNTCEIQSDDGQQTIRINADALKSLQLKMNINLPPLNFQAQNAKDLCDYIMTFKTILNELKAALKNKDPAALVSCLPQDLQQVPLYEISVERVCACLIVTRAAASSRRLRIWP